MKNKLKPCMTFSIENHATAVSPYQKGNLVSPQSIIIFMCKDYIYAVLVPDGVVLRAFSNTMENYDKLIRWAVAEANRKHKKSVFYRKNLKTTKMGGILFGHYIITNKLTGYDLWTIRHVVKDCVDIHRDIVHWTMDEKRRLERPISAGPVGDPSWFPYPFTPPKENPCTAEANQISTTLPPNYMRPLSLASMPCSDHVATVNGNTIKKSEECKESETSPEEKKDDGEGGVFSDETKDELLKNFQKDSYQ